MLFSEVVEKVLGNKFAYKNGQPQYYTISKIIAQHEGKEYISPIVDMLNKFFTNTFIISEDAKTDALKGWRNNVVSPIQDPNALYVGSWYVYLEEGINVGYIYTAITYGNVPIIPSFFREEDFGECVIYYDAELRYPYYKFSLADFIKTLENVYDNEKLYYLKLNCLERKFHEVTLI
ncbi:hypothetical protein J5U23_00693 [Saccharolobus shibatae B12]|uniref:Uncharacterized protein n=1 Tax=Saccharolobus shibatae (strain ATCC 51178 / DSM 5389 / JCM 8931 / NBRC 15437 / B12) TaxID=523848 RepID=A0A8F5GSG5_SACSH|nr:hypothetical protein [Saccharolobus shibatae]QXJ27825.1 hypothetical protein J5U23_00693 [Saccharolobus shibatae B12]